MLFFFGWAPTAVVSWWLSLVFRAMLWDDADLRVLVCACLQLGMNEFADMTVDEYRQHALGYDAKLLTNRPLRAEPFIYEDTVAPAEIDWREKGAVAKVKNQLLVSAGLRCPA